MWWRTSRTEPNTGRPRCKVPAFLGLTPPTMFVPYSMACWLWKVPVLPVKPWQITLVCLKTAGGGALACEDRGAEARAQHRRKWLHVC